jgi:uncharacterized protein
VQSVLLDAGPMVALFSKGDIHHSKFDDAIRSLSKSGLLLMSTWPCVVEATHLLDAPLNVELLDWIGMGGVAIYNFDLEALQSMTGWMRRYSDSKRQMDLADASLYWLAADSGVRTILTTDLNDFRRYRLPGGAWFNILD